MDNTGVTTDDQELAKVLESMNQQSVVDNSSMPAPDLGQAPAPQDIPAPDPGLIQPEDQSGVSPFAAPTPEPAPVVPEEPALAPAQYLETPLAAPVAASLEAAANPELETIKKDAVEELRPLVDKLNLPADEKFDTLLLIIRSTDDRSLVGAAYAAAKAIEDETKRAQALLDVIKEIDYFAGNSQQP